MSNLLFRLKFHRLLADLLKKNQFVFGEELTRFEERLASYVGAKYAIGVGSGTDALVYSLKALDIGPGDEVIVPAMSFVATASAVAWVGAKPVFVDIDPLTSNIDPGKIEPAITERTKALLPVHLHGRLAEMDAIAVIAAKHNLHVIEDAAQAIGSTYKGKALGHLGTVAALSFSPTKILSALGDGGAVITNDESLARKLYMLRNYGARRGETYFKHDLIGVSSRLDNFQAGVLNIKLDYLDILIGQYRERYLEYAELATISGLVFQSEYPDEFVNGYRFTIQTERRSELIKYLRERGVYPLINYPVPLPYLKVFGQLGYTRGDFPVAENAAERTLTLPTSPVATKPAKTIVGYIKDFFCHA